MAKRRRLGPATPDTPERAPEIKGYVNGWAGSPRAPIADVAGDAAQSAAFEAVAGELQAARAEGRMVQRLPLEAVDEGHLVRDRVRLDDDEMAPLLDSLRARGQQTPIEAIDLGGGRYGLISGWRRLSALRQLSAETGEPRFAQVQALIRTPEGAPEAYLAMVEENEIRAGLSFYERARIAVQAARQGIHRDANEAVQALFAAATPSRRSKITSFVALVDALDDHLQFPAAIPEKLGLSLAGALKASPAFRRQLSEALRKSARTEPADERRVLERSLQKASGKPDARAADEIAPGVALKVAKGRLTLSGKRVDAALEQDLRRWLAARG